MLTTIRDLRTLALVAMRVPAGGCVARSAGENDLATLAEVKRGEAGFIFKKSGPSNR